MVDPSVVGKLYVAKVLHKTFININEAGTEAAGATSVIIGTTAVRQGVPEATLTIDRPFFYAIRDQATGSILFLGQVANPLAG
jgi:serpin B